ELFNLEYDTLGSWNGLHFWETSSSNKSSELKYCIFEYAKAIPEENYPHPECGGAISLYNFSKLLVQNCIFRYNIASYGGSLSCSFFSNPQISNNLFHNNYAWKKGSAIFISNSYPTLNSNTITANVDLNTDIYSSTASVFNFLSKTKFYNNIVYNNTTNYFEQLSLYQAKAFYTEFNNFKNSEMGGTNLSIPPQFIAPEDNNYALNIDSECIDSGSNNMPAVYAQLDLSGNPRIVGTNLDIGAYEYFTTHNLQEEIYSPPIKLSQNFPNPFIPHLYQSGTKIKYSIRNISKDAFINIYNTKGQLIKKIPINSKQGFIIWDGTDSNSQKVVSGLYLYELSSQNYKVVKKMILLR
ncbi:MAG: choice-of-anchor Q domain-containing protein, partial [Candidatus Cloacimonadota bacterium]|nr:choice-of-anchor Q domain-containing protein [Candidatus Cloacimonadota bacterium]